MVQDYVQAPYELGPTDQAIAINKSAFEGAISEIELLDEEEFKDSAKILEILHYNLKNLADL